MSERILEKPTIIEDVKNRVELLLGEEQNGHGIDHMFRVLDLAVKFAVEENADLETVALSALLHDVDDYKLVGQEAAGRLENAHKILAEVGIDDDKKFEVISIVGNMGYSKLLEGIRPISLEGKIVSDADMCDAIGVQGIIRVRDYSASKGRPFFDKDTWPLLEQSPEEYKKRTSGSSVNHMFEKLLKLKDLMLTEAGKTEATVRHNSMVEFLRDFFREQDMAEWSEYLENYLVNLGESNE